MTASLRPIASLLAAVLLLICGHGLLGTLLAVRGGIIGLGAAALGGVMAAYFAGFLLGSVMAPRLIRRVGHIRAFAIAAAFASVATLGHAVFDSAWIWAGLRLLSGLALVCLYTVIESWLNADAPPALRGRVFAIYMGVHLGALALGQQLLMLAPVEGFELFGLVAALTSLALVPMAWTRQAQPALSEGGSLGPAALIGLAPTAVGAAIIGGLVMGAFWGLAPVAAAGIGLDTAGIAAFMTAAIVGGALLQWPLGRWSDRSDRRWVLALLCLLAVLPALVLALAPASWRLPAIFLYGGLSMAIYPIALAHLIDRVGADQAVAASAGYLLLYGLGAALGPLLAGQAMAQLGPEALWLFSALLLGLLGGYTLLRRLRREAVVETVPVAMPMLRTTPVALAPLEERVMESECEPEPRPEPEPEPEPEPKPEQGQARFSTADMKDTGESKGRA